MQEEREREREREREKKRDDFPLVQKNIYCNIYKLIIVIIFHSVG
jgi:hypothetical protein